MSKEFIKELKKEIKYQQNCVNPNTGMNDYELGYIYGLKYVLKLAKKKGLGNGNI